MLGVRGVYPPCVEKNLKIKKMQPLKKEKGKKILKWKNIIKNQITKITRTELLGTNHTGGAEYKKL